MIKSLKEARNAQIHYLKSGDIDEAAAMSESVVEDSAEKAGLTAEEVFGVADNLATLANRHTTRLTIVKPMHKGAGNDD